VPCSGGVILAACGGKKGKRQPVGAPPTGNRSASDTVPGSSAAGPAAGATELPFGLKSGTIHVVVTGSSPQTFELAALGSSTGQIVGAAQGPGYNFYTSEANGVVFRFPPTGTVGSVLSSHSLLSPLDVEVDLSNTSHNFLLSGGTPGDCTATLTQVSSTALAGTVSCTGLKDTESQATADVSATFSLTP
jgi:hypothetical protein